MQTMAADLNFSKLFFISMTEEKEKTRKKKNSLFVEAFIEKWKLRQRDGECCNTCKIRFYLSSLTIDHIKPKHLGGSEDLKNKQLLCFNCHKIKTKKENKAKCNKLNPIFLTV